MTESCLLLPGLETPRRFPQADNCRASAAGSSPDGRCPVVSAIVRRLCARRAARRCRATPWIPRSEEHTSELQSLMRISYAVFCLKKKNKYLTLPYIEQ